MRENSAKKDQTTGKGKLSVKRMDEKQRVCGIPIKKGLLGRRSSVETIVLLELETWKWKKLRFLLSTIAPV